MRMISSFFKEEHTYALKVYLVLQNVNIAQKSGNILLAYWKESSFPWYPISDVSYSDECRTRKAFQYAKRMFPLFRAEVYFFINIDFILLPWFLIPFSQYLSIIVVATGILFSIVFHVGTKEPKGHISPRKVNTGETSSRSRSKCISF